MHPIG
jgi:hypothetical protein